MEDYLKTLYHKAASFCAYQERTHDEVRNKLSKLHVPDEDCELIIARLIEDNYLNEQRYAQTFAGGKFRIKKWGRRKIIFELKKKNISEYTLKNSLKVIPEEDYREVLRKLAVSKFEQLSKTVSDKLKLKQKLVTFLMHKGYEQDLVWQTVNSLVS